MLPMHHSLRLFTVILPAFILAGCFWQTQSSIRYDYFTRITEVSSKSYQKVTDPLIRLEMNAKWISNQGFVIDTSVSSLNANDLDLGLVWSDKRHYRYVTREELTLFCTIGCTAIEKGRIFIPAEEFKQFATTGFTFKLVGRGHFINGYLYPEAFQEVLDQMENLPKNVVPQMPKAKVAKQQKPKTTTAATAKSADTVTATAAASLTTSPTPAAQTNTAPVNLAPANPVQ